MKDKIELLETLVEKDLSNGKCIQKKIKQKIIELGSSPQDVVEAIKETKQKRTQRGG